MGEGPPGFPQGFSCPAVLRIPLRAGRLSPTGLSPSGARFSKRLRLAGRVGNSTGCGPATPPGVAPGRFRLVPVRSPLLGKSRLFSLPPGTEMVHFPGWARALLWIGRAVSGVGPEGLPHWEIPGSKPVCGSPGLIAADHVLPRLLMPRHPLSALSSLTIPSVELTYAHSVSSVKEQGAGLAGAGRLKGALAAPPGQGWS